MLGLSQQVEGDQPWIGPRIGNDHHIGRSRDAINPNMAKNLPLGFGYIGVAGANNAVNRANGLRAISHGSHSLRTANAVDFGHTGAVGGGKDQRVNNPIGGWYAHGQPFDACNLGGNGVHQHGGGVGSLAARYVQSGCIQRDPAHPQCHPHVVRVAYVRGKLFLVEALNPSGGNIQRIQQFSTDLRFGLSNFFRCKSQFFGCYGQAVKAFGQGAKGGISLLAHGGQNVGYRGGHFLPLFFPVGQQCCKSTFKTRVTRIKPFHGIRSALHIILQRSWFPQALCESGKECRQSGLVGFSAPCG